MRGLVGYENQSELRKTLVELRDALQKATFAIDGLLVQQGQACGVVLLSHGNNKITCIKLIREATGWGLKESKDAVERTPTKIPGVTKEKALELADKLVEAGAEALFCNGTDCENCKVRFKCYTTRWR